MPSGRVIFACSLTVSATVHVLLWWTVPRYYGHPGGPTLKTPVARLTLLEADTPPSAPKLKPIFGDASGGGIAIDSSAADTPQAGPKPLIDQAAFTRDPTGQGRAAEAVPRPLAQALTAPPPAAVPVPKPSPFPSFRKPPESTPEPQSPRPPEPPRQATVAAPSPPAGGTPLRHSDKDSDPFAKEWAAEVRNGEVVSRTGRQLKMMRPKFSLNTRAEATEIAFPATTTFKVRIDDAGHVREATVDRSSGSPSLDRAFLLSIYQSWFEPAKDDAGRSVGDAFTFSWTMAR